MPEFPNVQGNDSATGTLDGTEASGVTKEMKNEAAR
jgi:hypothetical protein